MRGGWGCSLRELQRYGSLPTHSSERASDSPAEAPSRASDICVGLTLERRIHDPLLEMQAPLSSHLNLLDLELMHHYSTVTCYSFSVLPFKQNTWQDAVPREAQSYNFLMHAMLAIAAVQLVHARPDGHQLYKEAARRHQNLALRTSIQHLHNVTQSNCHALFALSSIVAMLALKFPYPSNSRSSSAPVDEIVDFFRLIRGVKTVLESASDWLLGGWLAPLLHYDWDPTLVPLPDDLRVAFDEVEARNDAVTGDLKDRKAYHFALRNLKIKFQTSKVMEEEPALVFAWPVGVQEHYISALRRHEPMATVILAYYSVLLHTVDEQWWAAGRGSHLIEAISRTLPPEWLPLIQWPRESVQLGWRCVVDRTPGCNSWRSLCVPQSISDDTGSGKNNMLQQDWYQADCCVR